MDEHSDCFSVEIAKTTAQLKREFSRIRMPFAKQELRNRKGPIFNENAFSSIGNDGMVFTIEGQDFNSKALIRDLLNHLASIGPNEILKEIPTARGTQASSITPSPDR